MISSFGRGFDSLQLHKVDFFKIDLKGKVLLIQLIIDLEGLSIFCRIGIKVNIIHL